MSLGEMMKQRQVADEAHISCFCRPQVTHCGMYTPQHCFIEVVGMDSERVWCFGCLVVFEGNGCGICGCKFGALCDTCDAAFQQ